ncbi:MAG: hypothetical protein INR73_11075 [Williamsia sp.]|nr:hypothetical protein [Williamsia sp.]
MKKIFFLAGVLLTINGIAQAQLDQTKWKGRILVPDEADGWLVFKKDTLEVFVSNGNSLLETMAYTLVRDTLMLKKISGKSSCEASAVGKYKWAMNADNLLVTPISDDCEARYKAWVNQPFVRQKD